MRPARLPLYVGALLMPLSAAAQNSTFTVESGDACARGFLCLQRDDRTGAPSSAQSKRRLYLGGHNCIDYLKTRNCIGLTEGFARVMRNQGQYVCIYDPKDKNSSDQALCLDANRYVVEMIVSTDRGHT